MSAFSSVEAAETRVVALMAANTVVQGHSCRLKDGTIAIRIQRWMGASGTTEDGMNKAGAWDVLTDDSET